jgi:hypothetical protein
MRVVVHAVQFVASDGQRYDSVQVNAPVDTPLYRVAEDEVREYETGPGVEVSTYASTSVLCRRGRETKRLRHAIEDGWLVQVGAERVA